jgi:hypothetical protein
MVSAAALSIASGAVVARHVAALLAHLAPLLHGEQARLDARCAPTLGGDSRPVLSQNLNPYILVM